MTGSGTAERHVAIIGAGFSGTLLAINLLRHEGPRVTLIEQRDTFAQGVAYSTGNPSHLLNVRAGNMSALPDQPNHFAEWLVAEGEGERQTFATRREFGRYLNGLLHQAAVGSDGRLRMLQARAVGLHWPAGGAEVQLANGRLVCADHVVLALGNLPPHEPPELSGQALPPEIYVADPWAAKLGAGLTSGDTVLILGTGLTMVDVAITLREQGFGGRIVALSRRGLVPRAHSQARDVRATVPLFDEKPGEVGSALLRRARAVARQTSWHAAVDALRFHAQGMWMAAPNSERERFLRHLRPWWDIHRHRHRLAPQVAARLEAMRAQGGLEIVAGKLTTVDADKSGAEVRFRPRHAEAIHHLRAARIINCTSPAGDLLRSCEPLLRQLVEAGDIRPGRHGLGIDVNAKSEVLDVSGRSNPALLAMGPLTRGTFWEITSVPDIRLQAWSVARRLSNAHWVEGEGL